MMKPAIPPVPKPGENRTRFDQAVKESIEILVGRRGGQIAKLDAATATTAQCAAKINEILDLMQ